MKEFSKSKIIGKLEQINFQSTIFQRKTYEEVECSELYSDFRKLPELSDIFSKYHLSRDSSHYHGLIYPLPELNGPIITNSDLSNPKMVVVSLEDLIHPLTGNPIRLGMISLQTVQISSYGSENLDNIMSFIEQEVQTGNYDIIVTPEYCFFPKNGPMDANQLSDYKEKLKSLSNKGVLIIANFISQNDQMMRNTTFGFYKGKEIFSYDKMIDGGEKSIAKRYGLIQIYGQAPCFFEWEGFKCFLEVCADAGTPANLSVANKDLYFLVSCGYGAPHKGYIHKKGYAIVVDGLIGESRVLRNDQIVDNTMDNVIKIDGKMYKTVIHTSNLHTSINLLTSRT